MFFFKKFFFKCMFWTIHNFNCFFSRQMLFDTQSSKWSQAHVQLQVLESSSKTEHTIFSCFAVKWSHANVASAVHTWDKHPDKTRFFYRINRHHFLPDVPCHKKWLVTVSSGMWVSWNLVTTQHLLNFSCSFGNVLFVWHTFVVRNVS